MVEDLHFLRDAVVDVDAAVVGVSRVRWVGAEEGEAPEVVRRRMEEGGFDVLPVTADPVRDYYRTVRWGHYDAVERHAVRYEDVIPITTPIRTVIKSMAGERRSFYFLASDARITGLITVANLNCRQVRTYLFSLISELEMRMGEVLSRGHSEADLLACNLDKRTRGRFTKDRATGVDAPLTEYFYFKDFAGVFQELRLFKAMGYKRRDHFERHMADLNDLRNEVAHPTKSLVKSPAGAADLWRRVQRIERALFHLRQELTPLPEAPSVVA